MFDDLYYVLSFGWSWKWPSVQGTITEVLIERLHPTSGNERCRLSVTYEFSVGADGPYTGEDFWNPYFFSKRRTIGA